MGEAVVDALRTRGGRACCLVDRQGALQAASRGERGGARWGGRGRV